MSYKLEPQEPFGPGLLDDLDDVPEHLQREIEHFLSVYKDLEDDRPELHGFAGREEALETVRASYRRARRSGAALTQADRPAAVRTL